MTSQIFLSITAQVASYPRLYIYQLQNKCNGTTARFCTWRMPTLWKFPSFRPVFLPNVLPSFLLAVFPSFLPPSLSLATVISSPRNCFRVKGQYIPSFVSTFSISFQYFFILYIIFSHPAPVPQVCGSTIYRCKRKPTSHPKVSQHVIYFLARHLFSVIVIYFLARYLFPVNFIIYFCAWH